MAVPLLDVNAQNLPLEAELKATFERVLRSGQFIMGPDVAALEKEIAAMTGARHAIGVSSGTDAILLALMALDIKAGDEVLCPSYTFFATGGCIARTGATPVFVESCPACFNMDFEDAAAKLTNRTKAIMPVHLFGQSADMDPILEFAKERKLPVIEDAAQALGAEYHGRQIGTMGTFGTYSFFPSKNLGGFGDGGMLVSNDDALAEKARLLRTHGAKPKYYHKLVGANFRLDSLQAALLRVKLPHYVRYTANRRANANFYCEKLSLNPHVKISSACDCRTAKKSLGLSEAKIILPVAHPGNSHIWNQFTLRVPGQRDAFRTALTHKGIGTEIYYPVPLHQQECFSALPARRLPVAEQLAQEAISIPVYPELTATQREEVVSAVNDFLQN
ncbi:MAG: DegT/DnrJ/EryC1/StrS family aminotransferase [Verrucomicrobiota bacterium]|nr:DegT/DnrJ/EryC1/StrS family aminotransferase [Verrucomicrobiota bacterium]